MIITRLHKDGNRKCNDRKGKKQFYFIEPLIINTFKTIYTLNTTPKKAYFSQVRSE